VQHLDDRMHHAAQNNRQPAQSIRRCLGPVGIRGAKLGMTQGEVLLTGVGKNPYDAQPGQWADGFA